jgi:hypothetical protein
VCLAFDFQAFSSFSLFFYIIIELRAFIILNVLFHRKLLTRNYNKTYSLGVVQLVRLSWDFFYKLAKIRRRTDLLFNLETYLSQITREGMKLYFFYPIFRLFRSFRTRIKHKRCSFFKVMYVRLKRWKIFSNKSPPSVTFILLIL